MEKGGEGAEEEGKDEKKESLFVIYNYLIIVYLHSYIFFFIYYQLAN